MATSALSPADFKKVQLNNYLGIDTITSQIEKKFLKSGFQFNIMVVGSTGLGKTTFINTLFASHILDKPERKPDTELRRTVDITATNVLIEENGVALKLKIIDTPGLGDNVNNDNCWEAVNKYIKEQHRAYLFEELSEKRPTRIPDNRIHCVLYFIAPTGHSLRPIDILLMEKLGEYANVIPIIGKSDTLTIEERAAFKKRIQTELSFYNLSYYPIDRPSYDTPAEIALNQKIRSFIPFAVVGSEKNVLVDGKAVRGRKNRWGVVDIENETHCEFILLKNFIIKSNMKDLIDTTAEIYYEKFRLEYLRSSAANK